MASVCCKSSKIRAEYDICEWYLGQKTAGGWPFGAFSDLNQKMAVR